MYVFHSIGGLPLARFPLGDHCKIFLGHLSSDRRSTCHYHCKDSFSRVLVTEQLIPILSYTTSLILLLLTVDIFSCSLLVETKLRVFAGRRGAGKGWTTARGITDIT
ncbi:hypothetical protein C0J52_22445 [Blattella germanica]|nr:hypothetical protein C0J52_22445 [Blattella germanica]